MIHSNCAPPSSAKYLTVGMIPVLALIACGSSSNSAGAVGLDNSVGQTDEANHHPAGASGVGGRFGANGGGPSAGGDGTAGGAGSVNPTGAGGTASMVGAGGASSAAGTTGAAGATGVAGAVNANAGGAGGAVTSPPTKPGYTLTFHDEFDSGTAPNPAAYFFFPTWGDQNNPAEDPAFLQGDTTTVGIGGLVAGADTVAQGFLNVTATHANARFGGQTFPYRTGFVRLRMAQLYGYFEVSAKLPAGQGLWPAFWLMPGVYNDSAVWEVDGLEAPSTSAKSIYMNAHWGSGFNTAGHMQNLSNFAGDFSKAFHTFGISWQSDALIWYVDGVERKRQTASGSNIPTVAMQLICNLAVGGSWPGSPDASTPFPSVFQIDYIRIYQKN